MNTWLPSGWMTYCPVTAWGWFWCAACDCPCACWCGCCWMCCGYSGGGPALPVGPWGSGGMTMKGGGPAFVPYIVVYDPAGPAVDGGTV